MDHCRGPSWLRWLPWNKSEQQPQQPQQQQQQEQQQQQQAYTLPVGCQATVLLVLRSCTAADHVLAAVT
jgi:hypothetical protein